MATAALVGGLVAVGLTWPNTAPHENVNPSGPLKINFLAPKKVRLRLHDRTMALAVAAKFVDTAVARKNVDVAWNLVTPTMRAGYTRKQWHTENLPGIPPFPVASARWRLQFSDVKGVGFTIALFPTKASHQQAQVFMIGLHKVGVASHRHWLVDNWQAAPTTGGQIADSGGSAGPGAFGSLSPVASPGPSKAKEGPIWLLLPLGFLSLILIIPASIAGMNWYRARRANALFGD
jgi:hypothetical protein